MCSGIIHQSERQNAEALLAVFLTKHLGVPIDRTKLRVMLRDHLHKIGPLAHAVHDAAKREPEAESWPYEFVPREDRDGR
jgi:hypothetical protein